MAKRKTHEEYVAELAVKNPGVTVVGEYVNGRTKIQHQCGRCKKIWSVSPNNLLHNAPDRECRSCSREKAASQLRRSHDEYVTELSVKNPGVAVIGDYVNGHTKIDHRCVCGASWKVAPDVAVQGGHCQQCGIEKRAKARRKTPQEYAAWVAKNRPSLKLLGKYEKCSTPISHRCECGNVWNVRPSDILNGAQCRKCHGKNISQTKTLKTEQYEAWLMEHKPWIQVLGKYKGRASRIEHKCSRTGGKFITSPNNLKAGGSCPCCKSYRATDGDVFYIWENTQDPGVYKVGITSERCADERIAICSRKNGMTANVILMASTPDARDIERRALELGDDPRYPDTIDGYTEFRRYSDAELGEVWRMAVGA